MKREAGTQTAEQMAAARELTVPTRRLCERARCFEDDADPYLRGLVATRVYRDHSEMPVVWKRAEILARTLEQLPPIVLPEERIIGPAYRRFRTHAGVSDAEAWRRPLLYPDHRGFNERALVPPAVRAELSWWTRACGRNRLSNEVRQREAWLGRYALANPHGWLGGHTLPDHGILLRNGIGALRDQIAERRHAGGTDAQLQQLAAMDRCLEGLSRHGQLCARTARAKAADPACGDFRTRLLEVAYNCETIAIGPPRTFAQALQLVRFSNFADQLDTPGDAASYGRIDQLLAPFYYADIRAGDLTPDDAFDLVCHFLIKCWCVQTSINMTVGGVDVRGADATNELSVMFLEAMEATERVTNICVRLHRQSPAPLVRTAARVLRRRFGRPNLYNDEVAIEALTRHDVAPEDARDYAPLGCVEIMIPGRTAHRTMCMGLNLPKVLELVLNRGRCLLSGDPVWPDVPASFTRFSDLMREYRRRVRQVVRTACEIIREDERIESMVFPRPWLTVLSHGGIERATDLTAGQPKYDPVGVTLNGIADITNALYAVKVLVFDTRRLSLQALRKTLRADWKGAEPLRRFVVNRLPRFGQDDGELNAIARAEAAHYADCFRHERTAYGGRFWPMIFGVSTGLLRGTGPKTGATAAGRRSRTMLAPSLQPSPAGPQGSVTALLRSAAAIDYTLFPGGVSNVQEFDPSSVSGPDGLARLTDLITGFFAAGGMELSLNFLDETQLRAAQANPDRYRHLIVRVFGLSAQFVNLAGDVQEMIIERVRAAARRACGPSWRARENERQRTQKAHDDEAT
ncbi:MAG: hypothetical protein JXR37_14205 [Kiritimatiellae bacterium]|nr:hypothetical protein [Kiritimatiellia bacterium]